MLVQTKFVLDFLISKINVFSWSFTFIQKSLNSSYFILVSKFADHENQSFPTNPVHFPNSLSWPKGGVFQIQSPPCQGLCQQCGGRAEIYSFFWKPEKNWETQPRGSHLEDGNNKVCWSFQVYIMILNIKFNI